MKFKLASYFLLIYIVYYNSEKIVALLNNPVFLSNVGVFSCFSLATIGTAKGILSIGNVVSGTAIIIPRVWARSTVGTLVCESNLIIGFVMSIYLYGGIDHTDLHKSIGIFVIGLLVGISCYISSVSAGLICSAITVIDGKDRRIFSRIAIFELLAGSYGIFALALGFFLNGKFK